MLLVGALLAVAIGVTLGLLGGGGSILTLPLLVYVLRVEPRSAIAASLLVVGVTSAIGLIPHVRARRVQWSTGIVLGVSGMFGAAAGARLAHQLPAGLLLGGFAMVMIVTAIAMFRPVSARASRNTGFGLRALIGAGVGVVSGLFGAGGGFLVVPALVTFAGLGMREAIATSLLVIAMQALAGFATHAAHVTLDVPLVTTIAAATSVGAVLGARWSNRIEAHSLRRGFGILVLVTGTAMLLKQVPGTLLQRPELPLVALVMVAMAFAFFVSRVRSSR